MKSQCSEDMTEGEFDCWQEDQARRRTSDLVAVAVGFAAAVILCAAGALVLWFCTK